MATFTRMDTLLCGALGALIFRQAHVLDRLRKWLPWIASTAVVTFLAGASLMRSKDGPWGILLFAKTFGFGVLAVGFAALVLHAAATDGKITLFQRLFRSDLLTEFGKYSYGIYVYHVPMLWFCDFFIYSRLPRGLVSNAWFSLTYFALLIAVSFFIAKLSYKYPERRFLDLKRRFEPHASKISTAAAGMGAK